MKTIELNEQQVALIKIALDEFENGKWEIGKTNKDIKEQIISKLEE
jgi:hypothetical protein